MFSLHSPVIKRTLPLLLISTFFFESCKKNPYTQGAVLYTYHCENCHMSDGSGLVKLIPRIDTSPLLSNDPEALVCLIRSGVPVNPETGQEMPPNKQLNDVELTNLVNFLGYRFGGKEQTVTVEDIARMLAYCQTD